MAFMISESLKRSFRLIKLIQEVKCTPCQTVDSLRRRLAVSKAQFYKDRAALAGLGFEFSYDRARGCFVITRDAYLPIENLSISERLSLLMAVRQISAAGDYILSFQGLSAARKLTADLPAPLRETARALFDDLVLREGFGCEREVMEKLQTAVAERRRTVLRYRLPGSDAASEHEVEPYHLFFKRRSLYVEGYSWTEKALRMYRLNRIAAVSFTPMCFSVPGDYDFGRRHRNAFSAFPGESTETVVVRFSSRARDFIAESLWHHSQQIRPQPDGSIRFTVEVAEPREVLWWAFQWGADAEIVKPAWLREEARAQADRMQRAYAETR